MYEMYERKKEETKIEAQIMREEKDKRGKEANGIE